MEDPRFPPGDGGGGFRGVHSPAGGFHPDQLDVFVRDEIVEQADGIAAAPYAGHDHIGQPAFLLQHLGFHFFPDDFLEITDDGGIGMGPHAGSQHIEGVFHIGAPIPHGLADRVLQGAGAGGHWYHFGPQKFHPVHVQGLADGVLLAHVHFTFQAHESRHSSGGHPVLAGAGFGDDPFLAHFLGQEALAQGVVDLVSPGVVQVFPFQIDFGAPQIPGHLFRIVQQAGPVGIVMVQSPQFLKEFRIILEPVVGFVQLQHCVHQGFR